MSTIIQTQQRDSYYHIILKGHTNTLLFRHPHDYDQFLRILTTKKKQFAFDLLGFCLLEDHLHLIIELATRSTLSSILHGLSLLYTKYYQSKYGVSGPVFSGRGLSEIFHSSKELLCRIRYIHNKVKHTNPDATLFYPYSSYTDYAYPDEISSVNRRRVYCCFDRNNFKRAANFFLSIHHAVDATPVFDIEDNLYAKVDAAKKILKEELLQYNLSFDEVQQASHYREALILKIYKETGLNQQEVADLLSLSRHIVGRAIRFNKLN